MMAAKLVGRYYSGAPLAELRSRADSVNILPANYSALHGVLGQGSDPGPNHPALQPQNINNFGYRDDPDGYLVPHAAHIRWTGPGQLTAKEAASKPTTSTERVGARGKA